MFQKQISRQGLHTLPTQKNEVAAIHHKILDCGIRLIRMLPVNCSFTIHDGEGEESMTMKVGTIDCQLAGKRNGRSGKELHSCKKAEQDKKKFV